MARVLGTSRPDTLLGTVDDDEFNGRESSDLYVIGLDEGNDSFADSGTTGWDVIVAAEDDVVIGLASGFGPQSGIEEISANGNTGVWITTSDGNDVLDFSGTVLTGIDKISGQIGNDTIIGSAGNDDIRGNNNNDRLDGGDGNDLLLGGAGNDLDPDQDIEHGRDGNDTLLGRAGRDELAGGSDDDRLYGGGAADTLHGGTGIDLLTGGGGRDTFRFAATTQTSNTVLDFVSGVDVIDLALIDANTATASVDDAFSFGGFSAPQANSVTVVLRGGNTVLQLEVTGDLVVDMEITLAGTVALTGNDFLL